MTPTQVLDLLRWLGEAVGLGERLVELASQRHPELRAEPLPDRAEDMDQARDAALQRTRRT